MLRAAIISVLVLGPMGPKDSITDDFDCDKAYLSVLTSLNRDTSSRMSPERLAALHRRALRIYDACRTHDLHDPGVLFDRLRSQTL